MSPEKTQQIFNKYPYLYRGRSESTKTSMMSLGFENCEDGWFDLIDRVSSNLEHAAALAGLEIMSNLYPKVTQVKQKFGSLHFYVENANNQMSRLIEEAEKIAEQTCQACGSKGELVVLNKYNAGVFCKNHSDKQLAISQPLENH